MKEDNKLEKYFKKWQDLKLSESSRARIEKNLAEYARFHGAKEGERVGLDGRSIRQVPSFGTSISNLFNLRINHMTAALLIVLLLGGGTSFAAEGSLPGDWLYPVKVEINENVKSALTVGSKAEANLQAKLAGERLLEAEELASRGELDADTSAEVNARLKSHYDEAIRISDEVRAKGDVQSSTAVRASLEGILSSHANILTRLNVDINGNDSDTLITNVRAYADEAAEVEADADTNVEANVDAKANLQAALERTDALLAGLETKLERAKAKISADVYARIEAHLKTALEAQANAKAEFRAGAYRAAQNATHTAVRVANEVESMLGAILRIQINIPADILIDTRVDSRTSTDTSDADDSQSDDADEETRNADVETDADVDTGIIDANVDGSTSASGDLRLGI